LTAVSFDRPGVTDFAMPDDSTQTTTSARSWIASSHSFGCAEP
jgi:hypothetical protein